VGDRYVIWVEPCGAVRVYDTEIDWTVAVYCGPGAGAYAVDKWIMQDDVWDYVNEES
jgi:hypothetical protein